MPTGGSGTRIAHQIERYSLVGMGADLESRWSHTDVEAGSQEALEALTTYFNTAVVRTVFDRAGADPPEHSAEAVYQLLTADDPPAGDEAAVRAWLDEHGVDPDELSADFVSRREMHRYLRDVGGLDVPLRLTHPPDVAERHDITTEDLERRIESASALVRRIAWRSSASSTPGRMSPKRPTRSATSPGRATGGLRPGKPVASRGC